MNKEIEQKAKKWLSKGFDEETKQEVEALLKGDPKILEDAFYKDLEFGTGGLRGVMGVGTNRMNIYVVGMATQGLANYINLQKKKGDNPSVAIAFDSRINSALFAKTAAEVLSANGIKAFLFQELRPTPQLSFAVRHFGCTSGIVITASHNPKEYNGYKVYWKDGGQVVSPQDAGIIAEVRKVDGPSKVKWDANQELIELVDEKIDAAYLQTIFNQSLNPAAIMKQAQMPIVFTSLHGTGITQMPEALEGLGFKNVHIVPEQSEPDGDFPTVHSPNPEEKAALDLALKLAGKIKAGILLGTDPDSDRVGIAVPDQKGEMVLLNGNETSAVLTYYLLSEQKRQGILPENPLVCRTIVTTELIDLIAEDFGAFPAVTLTGFKYIAELIGRFEGQKKFVGGGEESYGYLIGDAVRDKDAIITGALLCELAAWAVNKGSSLYQELIDIYVRYGYYREALVSLEKKGKDGAVEIEAIMEGYRNNPPTKLAGTAVREVRDYYTGTIKNLQDGSTRLTGLPKSDVVQFALADGSIVTARPSGTEPKIKFYFSLKAKLKSAGEFEKIRKELDERIAIFKEAFVNG